MDKESLFEKKEQLEEALFIADLMGYDTEKYEEYLENLDKLEDIEINDIENMNNNIEETKEIIEELNEKYDSIEDSIETMQMVVGGLALVGIGAMTFLSSQHLLMDSADKLLMRRLSNINKKLGNIEKEIKKINEKISKILELQIEMKREIEILKEEFYMQNIKEVKEICYNIESYLEQIDKKYLSINNIKVSELFNNAITTLEKELEKIEEKKGIQLNLYLVSNLFTSIIIFTEKIAFEKFKRGENSISFEEKVLKISKKFITNYFLDSLREELIFKGILDNKKLDMIEEFFILKQKKFIQNVESQKQLLENYKQGE